MISKVNGKKYKYGELELSSLQHYRTTGPQPVHYKQQISLQEVIGDVQEMHQAIINRNALFQAASQFNLLEMVHPERTPEDGISDYQYDRTQGPACAIACGAGTIYRNYFVPLEDQIGQSSDLQIDCLVDIGRELGNEKSSLWVMQNGYALASLEGLKKINHQIKQLNKQGYELLKGKLKIGVQWHTQVTLSDTQHTLSQAYCSALPIAYSAFDAVHWEAFARLVLEATYEATFYAALKNYEQTNNPTVYLTLVGGGAFGNDINWILDAIKLAIQKFKQTPLDVKIVSYRESNPWVEAFIHQQMNDL